ncbi:Hypothetical Protein SLY_0359 [Strawberry lethal yellows phytoplasma (CPA) str. NZSb11]|uniref:Uncharacterized protein n=1 Tax=Strawberry lethal yellows phytoplasma (CPA) str. NZSb11 TaxID=980422 RepID=R4S0E3_PHYAS|nr:Hypothetical Protein SLY_0359 [Strawberry lethal yellows phytoplasma (CPA) str. NZSb11]
MKAIILIKKLKKYFKILRMLFLIVKKIGLTYFVVGLFFVLKTKKIIFKIFSKTVFKGEKIINEAKKISQEFYYYTLKKDFSLISGLKKILFFYLETHL